MKYVIGFFTGVLMTTIFFLWWTKKNLTYTNPVTTTEQQFTSESSVSSDFDIFYEQFHTDSNFQMAHILFPLQGIPPRDSLYTPGMEVGFKWQKEDWIMHQKFNDMDGTFERELLAVGDNLIVENIKLANGNYGMQRRFSKYDDGWYLIYYAGMNELMRE